MKWIDIKTKKPDKTYYSPCVMLSKADEQILVYGYDAINFTAQYRALNRDDVAEGRYDGLIITHWAEIERPT